MCFVFLLVQWKCERVQSKLDDFIKSSVLSIYQWTSVAYLLRYTEPTGVRVDCASAIIIINECESLFDFFFSHSLP